MVTIDKFENWNKLKQEIHFGEQNNKNPKYGEIWNIYNGINIGYESIGKGDKYERPVLVLKKLGQIYLCITMTTKGKDNNIFYYKLNNNYFNKKSYLTLSQGKCIDGKRFIKKIGELSHRDLFLIKKEIINLWF
ncbi:MAG: type II toxin-antitoxin system PemK/MazF family toxin [Candidatus Gracilibacteria bacterium]|nr:type II toxin-antitoxin system PemK/MazF family toxin [Candidatus Gracilibacteria bacterium]